MDAGDFDTRTVQTRHDLMQFVAMLAVDASANPALQALTLAEYLQAMVAWLESAESWQRNMRRFDTGITVDVEIPSWELFARLLRAATTYE